ncbi:hypothetical protein TTHERM_01055420 (macronuclear) [Tetrahymena thermophila SB210]|uniref:Uncharacterized protein n=1 Tax=Tetrahymena thermophila (strain SB210) TaxID=312017 RepID=Q24HP5_TETTS|nr:hypothetical protein TTHERM_01055420 [Tetrahymena thermophila SB210]EAS07266.4 hypothetical protein TTHERM_01055420 [Tetrahymena thermophila SB210]|eukprot:XP_001027508.4 hypothetical protein TTHERM_01055420 [Tetrahymena thermophila SB210]
MSNQQTIQNKQKESYNASVLNDKNQASKIQQQFRESFIRHSGWINVLDKYINYSTGHVSSEVPIDIYQFQQEIARKFNNFLISKEDVFTYFLSIKNQVIGLRDQDHIRQTLQDFVRELCNPAYYRECVDCQFFQQKCERMRKIIENNFEENLFKQLLDFLSEKRKQFTEQPSYLKSQILNEIVGQASSMRKKQEKKTSEQNGLKKFVKDCQMFVVIEDNEGNLIPASSQKKNKVVISNEKNKVSLVNELIQKLSQYEQLKLQEVPQPSKDGISNFQFELKGNDLSIKGEVKQQKQKAKESCCENVINFIIKSLQNNAESLSEKSSIVENESNYQDYLLFDAEDLNVAEINFDALNNEQMEEIDNTADDNLLFQSNDRLNNQNDQEEIDHAKKQQATSNQQQIEQKNQKSSNYVQNKENPNEYDKIVEKLYQTLDDLDALAKVELHPYKILKKLTEGKNKSESYKKLNGWLMEIIQSAVKLYDYEDFKQSPCVIVQENSKAFFLKTLIMKKKVKSQNLIGHTRCINEEHSFIFSALELIYKFAFKHQSHKGEITCLEQVIEGLILEAVYLSEEYERQKKESQTEKSLFTDKMYPNKNKQQINKSSNDSKSQFVNSKQSQLKEQFKLVL